MRRVLYILKKGPAEFSPGLLAPSSGEKSAVVLVQDAVLLKDLPLSPVYALADDATSRQVSSPYPHISYQDMLRMIMESDTVVAL